MPTDYQKPIRVTISDPDTGDELESRVLTNDYVIITAGNRYVKNIRLFGKTNVISVAVEKPLPEHAVDYAATTKVGE